MIKLLQVARSIGLFVVSIHPELHALSLPATHSLGNGNDAHCHALLQKSLLVLIDQLRFILHPSPHILRIGEQLGARTAHGRIEHILWRQHAVSCLPTSHPPHPQSLAHQRAARFAHRVGRHPTSINHLMFHVVGVIHNQSHVHHDVAIAIASAAPLHSVSVAPRAAHATLSIAMPASYHFITATLLTTSMAPRAFIATTAMAMLALHTATSEAIAALLYVLRMWDCDLHFVLFEQLRYVHCNIPRLRGNTIVRTIDHTAIIRAMNPLCTALLHVGFPLAVVARPSLDLRPNTSTLHLRC